MSDDLVIDDNWVRTWSASSPPPYHIEEHGYAYVICDSSGVNVARREDGAVLFWKPNRHLAEVVMEYLTDAR